MEARSKLRQLIYQRKLQGHPITQRQIAERANLSERTVSVWMNNRRTIERLDIQAWLAIAGAIGVEPMELLSIEPENN